MNSKHVVCNEIWENITLSENSQIRSVHEIDILVCYDLLWNNQFILLIKTVIEQSLILFHTFIDFVLF
jgi:hypothetical protein